MNGRLMVLGIMPHRYRYCVIPSTTILVGSIVVKLLTSNRTLSFVSVHPYIEPRELAFSLEMILSKSFILNDSTLV